MRELNSLSVFFSKGYGLLNLLSLGGTASTLVASCWDPPEMVLAKSVGGRLSDHSMPATITGGCRAQKNRGEIGARDMAVEAVGGRADASREDIERGSSGGKEGRVSEKMTEGGSVECSFKNKGTVKTQPLPLVPIYWCRICSENLVQGQNGNFKSFSKLLFYSRIIN